MELSAVDFTEEIRVCRRSDCKKKWTDDNIADRELWRTAPSRATGQFHWLCGRCVVYYSEKSRRECSGFNWPFCPHSDALAETSGAEPSRTTGQALPVQKLVANSQRGVGACPVK